MAATETAEFLAENELVDIIPTTEMSEMHLITGSFGPFRPLVKTKVPLWIALSLKTHCKCTILLPDWMAPEQLKTALEFEINRPDFSSLPFHWLELSSLILDAQSMPQSSVIKALLSDLRERRIKKIRDGLKSIDSLYLQTNNFGLLEFEGIRAFCTGAFNEMRNLSA